MNISNIAIHNFVEKHFEKMQSIKGLFSEIKSVTKESAAKLIKYFDGMDESEKPILISYILLEFKSIIENKTNIVSVDTLGGDRKQEAIVKRLMELTSQPLSELAIEITKALNELKPEQREVFILIILNAALKISPRS